ncbi:hypothetical protein I6F18_18935 [Bradyrhizobium sp. NBAIM32]|uniref:hypothetical protein n=1 Tax=Bradyrhizobium sp. NBAIM32 TaxID=2793809 RepID=UPI001CD5286A|nr:hypothetical protein [Bradyrhizobium sp. NBAIM32]MCA1542036.1 hypothetical protein [Bradyrhizobium sp. NBAIM32]
MYDDAATVRQGIAASVVDPAAARRPFEAVATQPVGEIEALAVFAIQMNPDLPGRRRAQQVHREDHHDGTFGEVLLALAMPWLATGSPVRREENVP